MNLNLNQILEPKNQLIIIGSRPALGKTTLTLQIADKILNQNIAVAIFSLENSKEMPLSKLTNKDNVYVDDTPNVSISYIEEQTRKLVKDHNVKVVIIDYIQLIKDYFTTDISSKLKELTEQLQITVIVTFQLTRDIETRADKKPILKDIKNKNLGKLADTVIFLYEKSKNNVDILIAKEPKVITFEEVEERLKNVKLEDMTAQDVFDRYIGYGDNKELNNIEIQKLLLKHNYIEYLISSVETIITNKTVIEKITSSDLFKDSKYHLIRGRIENIEIIEDKELPTGFEWLIVNLQTQAKEEYKLKYMYYPQKQESYKNEIEQHIGNDLMAIAEHKEKEYRLCCLLKVN